MTKPDRQHSLQERLEHHDHVSVSTSTALISGLTDFRLRDFPDKNRLIRSDLDRTLADLHSLLSATDHAIAALVRYQEARRCSHPKF